MKCIARLFALTALMATSLIGGAAPASATTDVCVGHGQWTTAAPLYYPGLGPPTVTTFTFSFNVGACALGHTASGYGGQSGLLGGGYCGQTNGAGTVGSHHTFGWVNAGSLLIISGGTVGVLNVVPNAASGESCVFGADRFLVTGALWLI